MRVGLVLGGGGIIGGSWTIGALEALEAETGWQAAEADQIVGTSAGAVLGSMTAAGIPAATMGAHTTASADDDGPRRRWTMPSLGPGSWSLAAATLLRPHQHSPGTLLAGWLPRGMLSTDPIRRLVEENAGTFWPERPAFWAVAADYANGQRMAFGRPGAPTVSLGEAVAASCAIPGVYRPVRIAGRRYVDGGIGSASNLDLLCGEGLDLVVCVNPMSSLAQATGGSPTDRLTAVLRAAHGRRLQEEARRLRGCGTEVCLLQPDAEDVALMGFNMMNGARRVEVLQRARVSVRRQLHDARERGLPLPGRSRRRWTDVLRRAA